MKVQSELHKNEACLSASKVIQDSIWLKPTSAADSALGYEAPRGPAGLSSPRNLLDPHWSGIFDTQATFPGEGEAEEWTHALVLKPISAGGKNSRELAPEVHCG